MILNDPWEQTVNLPQVQHLSLWRNVLQFLTKRIITLGLAVITAVYLTIIIANFGGFVDDIVSARIELQVGLMIRGGWLSELPPDERIAVAEQTIVEMQDAAGLNDPFLLRSARWLWDGLTLNWGEPERARIYDASATNVNVRDIIADNLSRTLLVFGVANVLMFVTAVFIALLLNRRHGGFLDRAFILLSPISSAPAWVYGVLLSTFLLRFFGFSSGGTLDFRLGDLRLTQLLLLLRHLLLPFAAMFLAGLFQTVYIWRSFFQVYRNEEYVDMAYAKGLSNGRIDRHYIMRPALPALLTSFALMLAVLWQEVIALEFFFNVQGIGRLFARALAAYDTPMIVAIVTTFAYLLAITVLILDVCYALVDPRVRVGSKEQQKSLAGQTRRRLRPKRRQRATSKRVWRLPRPNFVSLATSFRKMWVSIRETVRALREYKTAVVGLTIIIFLVIVSIYTVITIPYSEAIAIWHGEYDEWSRNPREALPSWVNLLRGKDLPPTLTYKSTEAEHAKQTTTLGDGLTKDTMPFAFDYDYADFPQDIILDITAQYTERGPHVAVIWVWPDGTERELSSFKPNLRESYFVSQDKRLQRRLRSDFPHQAIFLGSDGTAELPI
ncbi:MAG: ABC transporter permease, partial [Chloroflexi bacterium]|nr:ABC transporter permease [Chloroflexota bacterium]